MRGIYNKNPFEAFDSSSSGKTKPILDWEESALQNQDGVEGFAEEDRSATGSSLKWVYALVMLVAAIIGTRLFFLQVVNGSDYKQLAEGNRLRLQTILAPRGHIFDRYGEELARNTASFSLAVTPVDLPAGGWSEVLSQASVKFNFDIEDALKKIDQAGKNSIEPIIVKRGMTHQESIVFETASSAYPGLSVVSVPVRDYPQPEIFSHVLGYTGVVSDLELQKTDADNNIKTKYENNDFIGKSGIELSYEKFLRGQNGNNQVEVDAMGRPIKSLGSVSPKPGNILDLTIDAGLQKVLYEGFAKRSADAKGAAVALDPKTGEVLALVSVPGFNTNLFAPGISTQDYNALTENKNLPLFNRAVAGVYPPGSTIKMVTAAAALQENIVTPDTIINDNGVMLIRNEFNPSIVYRFVGWKLSGLGPMDVRSAIAQSSDIYFYTVSGGNPATDIKGLGADKLAEYYKKFSMGNITGIDLQGEKPGIVADPAWKENYFKNDPQSGKWYLGDTYHISIGQGDMLTTPLQVASWTSAIANNGTAYKPRILKEVKSQSGQTVMQLEKEVLVSPSVSDENMKVLQLAMRDNVTTEKGSGRSLQSLPITSAGKTGTSQFDGSDPSRTHAWYTVYAPFEDPKIVITILVEAGGEGHAAAVPIAKEALEWWADNRLKK